MKRTNEVAVHDVPAAVAAALGLSSVEQLDEAFAAGGSCLRRGRIWMRLRGPCSERWSLSVAQRPCAGS